MASSTTSLYISDSGIQLMVTRGKRITKLADVPMDINLNEVSGQEQEEELVNKIRLLFRSNRISDKKVILGISGLQCLTRPLSLPELPQTMVDEAITREAKRVLPISLEQLYLSWQIISSSEGKIEVYLVAIPKNIADNILNILHKAGIKPYLMDIKPLSLSRVSREATAIIVDVQPKEFDIIIMVNGIPQPLRTVPFPREYLTMDDRIPIVKDEFRRTIQFYNSNNPENPIPPSTTIFVSGELVDEQEIMDSMAEELGYKVAPLISPLKCVKQLDPSHHLTNIGLALKEVSKGSGPLVPNFNTLPTPYQPKQIPRERLMALPAAAAAVGLIALLVITVQSTAADIDWAKSQLESTQFVLEKKQAQKKETTTSIAQLESQLASTKAMRSKYVAALETMSTMGNSMNNDLSAVVDNMVTDLEVNSIGHSGERVDLSGKADSEQEIFKYVRILQDTGRFEEITISNITRDGASENATMRYTLALRLEGE
jgi:Tfp pilus assembly PilM family ATPase/Tfp pilus assembly protein PilN